MISIYQRNTASTSSNINWTRGVGAPLVPLYLKEEAMVQFTNITDFVISALPCIAGIIIGEVIIKVWEKHHGNSSTPKSK